MKFLLVFLGGGLGSSLRYLLSRCFSNLETSIPYGTLLVNVLGSFFIGIFIGLSLKNDTLSQNQVLFLTVGFCGGFTTFSSFSLENVTLLKNGDYVQFGIYILTSIFLGILAVLFGLSIVR